MKQDNIIATQGLTNLFAGQLDIDSTDKKVEFIKTKLREFNKQVQNYEKFL